MERELKSGAADCDGARAIRSNDVLAFFAALMSVEVLADMNGEGTLNSQDLFDFLSEFFVGCGG